MDKLDRARTEKERLALRLNVRDAIAPLMSLRSLEEGNEERTATSPAIEEEEEKESQKDSSLPPDSSLPVTNENSGREKVERKRKMFWKKGKRATNFKALW
jgi:hypothetical protein